VAPRLPCTARRVGSCEISEETRTTPPVEEIVVSVARYYSDKLDAYGPTPRGVDWNGEQSQQLRFTQLLRVLDGACQPAILDYGCGYGALAQRLVADGRDFRYVGFDVSESMIAAARSLVRDSRCRFTSNENEVEDVDFTLASGVFNVRLHATEREWHDHVVVTLEKIAACSRQGFAFNMLTRYADPPLMRDGLYYADPAVYFSLCKEHYSRNVALLHDYDLYEFTLLVCGGETPTPLVGRAEEVGLR
jgi:SAM-dependent methyltransferase